MKVERHTILHRKDEHGVIVESGVFGPDDEIPEGFGPQDFEVVTTEVRATTVQESKLTPWDSPVSLSWTAEDQPDDSLNDLEMQARAAAEAESEEDESQVNDGTPVQAREQSEDGELTEAEQEAAEDSEADSEAPPKGGPGSGKEAWAAYAAANDVDVPEDATRDDIIAACESAGVKTD